MICWLNILSWQTCLTRLGVWTLTISFCAPQKKVIYLNFSFKCILLYVLVIYIYIYILNVPIHLYATYSIKLKVLNLLGYFGGLVEMTGKDVKMSFLISSRLRCCMRTSIPKLGVSKRHTLLNIQRSETQSKSFPWSEWAKTSWG